MMLARRTGGSSDRVLAHLESEHSRRRTVYLRTIENWRASYPDEQIFVGFQEDVHFHPDELLARIQSFLGVERRPAPRGDQRPGRAAERGIPRPMALRLAELYGDLFAELDRTFGGWTSWWKYCCDRIVADGGGAEVTYPFYETALWTEWLEERGPSGPPPLQSGSLAVCLRHSAEAAVL
jgi:hypothetical protein